MALIGDPFVGVIPKQLSNAELAQAIRADIADEMEAILAYEAHAMATSDTRAKKIFSHISDEEKRHVGQLQQLLYILNPAEEDNVKQGLQAVQQQAASNFQQPMQ